MSKRLNTIKKCKAPSVTTMERQNHNISGENSSKVATAAENTGLICVSVSFQDFLRQQPDVAEHSETVR